jgi:hypothetical protein
MIRRMSNSSSRSFEKIETADLQRLETLASAELENLFGSDASSAYAGRRFLTCLCQGAARHFVHGDRGVKDFDVWAFFRPHEAMPFPYRWRGTVDFGDSKFGRDADSRPNFRGRRVDIAGRSIPIEDGETGVAAVQKYLNERRTDTALSLAEHPVIVLWPHELLGNVIWRKA